MEFSRQEYWSGLPFPSPGDLPGPGIEPGSPALQVNSLPFEPPMKFVFYVCVSISVGCILVISSGLAFNLGFLGSLDGKESTCNAGDPGSIPGLGGSP